jgi:serine/threonine protein kinase
MTTSLPVDQLLPGEIIAGKYKLIDRCGSGGMGSVWRATHLALDSGVAIKFLHGSVSRQSEARVRFEQEAKICAKLGEESLHVVRVNDHGVTEAGRPFLVMELLKGESLSERLEREGRLPLPLAAAITTQLCRALHAAHVAGVVHRDLKPANVFLSRSGGKEDDGVFVKLLDFGVAKATLAIDDPGVTRAGFIVGTPAYMSPEQITAEKFLDARADLWSVVAIVYRMVVGKPPFGTGTIAELGRRITEDDPVPPSKLVADVPPELDAWIARGLAKKRDERFQTTTDLADALMEVARVVAPPPSAVVSTARLRRSGPPRASEPSAADWQPPRAVSPLLILAGIVAAALVVAGALYARARVTTVPPPPQTVASSTPDEPASIALTTAPSTIAASASSPSAATPPSASASTSAKPGTPPPPKKPPSSSLPPLQAPHEIPGDNGRDPAAPAGEDF